MYWPEIYVCQIIWRFVFSFLTLLLTFSFKKKPKTHCTACLYGMLSRIILLVRDATALLPESECKGIVFSWTTKTFTIFFSWNFKPFLTDVDFQGLTKTQISGILWSKKQKIQKMWKTQHKIRIKKCGKPKKNKQKGCECSKKEERFSQKRRKKRG